MKSNKNKKIYIFNSSKDDILDFTLEFIDKIRKVDCVVSSKDLKKQTKAFISDNSNKLILIQKNKNLILKNILSLFSIFNEILYLKLSNNFFDNFLEEKIFFQNNGIQADILLNTIDIVDILNQKKLFLTNRKKNSAVIFSHSLKNKDLKKILIKGAIGKMVIKLETKKQLIDFHKIIKENSYFKKNYKFNLISENKLLNINLKSNDMVSGIVFKKNNFFLIVDEDVKI
tara:strand:- start:181 stop:867 length:687 start_codon:yes stop_codon:yes gene_type:complete